MDTQDQIIKKFNKLSTKEWLQYFQFKLSPDREKELVSHATQDPFLKDALDGFSDQNIRPIAHQSYNLLLSKIRTSSGNSAFSRNATGGSSSSMSYLNLKTIILGLVLLAAIIGAGFLINYLMNTDTEDNDYTQEEPAIEAIETDIPSEDENAPLEVIPNTESISQPEETSQTQSTTNNSSSRNQETNQTVEPTITETTNSPSLSTEEPSPSSAEVNKPNTAPTQDFSKENELFQKAQQLYTQGKYSESKQILQKLKLIR